MCVCVCVYVCVCVLGHCRVVQFSHVQLFATPWTTARQASLSITNSQSSPKPMSIESVMPSSHLILCCPLLFLPSIFPSIRVFSSESVLHIRWPKYWSFSFNISPSSEHPGLSFRMDWLDLLAVQGTPKSQSGGGHKKENVLFGSTLLVGHGWDSQWPYCWLLQLMLLPGMRVTLWFPEGTHQDTEQDV